MKLRFQILIGFLLAVAVSLISVTTANSSEDLQLVNNTIRYQQDSRHIERPTLSQVNQTSEKNTDAEDAVDSESVNNTDASNGSDDPCVVTLAYENSRNSQFTCARAFQISGKVEVELGDSNEGYFNIRELPEKSGLSKNRFRRNSEVLLSDAVYNIRTGKREDDGSNFLFNTLDLANIGKDSQFTFAPSSRRTDAEFDQLNWKNKIQLDFGKLAISNAVPGSVEASNPEVGALESQSTSIGIGNTEPHKSYLQRLWQSSKHHLSNFGRVLARSNPLTQPAFAEIPDQIPFTSTTLKVQTREALIESGGAVYLVERDPGLKRTQVYSMTMHPIRVTDKYGEQVELRRNQTVLVTDNGIDEAPFEFPLCGAFYRNNSDVLKGLAPQEELFVNQQPYDIQTAYHVARSKTLPLYHKNCQRRCPPRGSGV
jgi:hypothetical protein